MAGLQTQKEIDSIIRKYRKRLGIDSSIILVARIVEDDKSKKKAKERPADAWIVRDSTHPLHTIYISRQYLRANRRYPRHVIRTLVHELLHIVVGEFFARLKPSYSYDIDKDAHTEESMVYRLAKAVVPVASEELYSKM